MSEVFEFIPLVGSLVSSILGFSRGGPSQQRRIIREAQPIPRPASAVSSTSGFLGRDFPTIEVPNFLRNVSRSSEGSLPGSEAPGGDEVSLDTLRAMLGG